MGGQPGEVSGVDRSRRPVNHVTYATMKRRKMSHARGKSVGKTPGSMKGPQRRGETKNKKAGRKRVGEGRGRVEM